MARFTLPRDLYHGKGALDALKDLDGKRAIVVVGGGSMKRFGFLDKVEANLKAAGMEVSLFEGVEPDPSVETVMKGAEAMRQFQPDWIVAIGGGSPIDAAKAMWAFYEYPETTFEQLITPFSFPKLRTKARFCAIPSTSGTATEVTAFSVITDYAKGIKYPLADFNITPDVAIVDPELAETMPKKLTAHTGMDAMTHAIEAYVSTLHCNYTDPLALHAIKMISADLVDSYNGDMDARDRMHDAQCLAGMAFSNALLGIVHSMAHKTGAAYSGGRPRLRQRHVPAQGHRLQRQGARGGEALRRDRRVPRPGAHQQGPHRPHQGHEREAGHSLLHPGLRGRHHRREGVPGQAAPGGRAGRGRCLHRLQPPRHHPRRDGEAPQVLLLRH